VRLGGEQLVTAVLAAIITWLAASITFGSNGLTQLADLQHSREELTAEVVETGNRIAEVQRLRGRLGKDPQYLETIARTELGMIYPDEVLYRFRTPGASP